MSQGDCIRPLHKQHVGEIFSEILPGCQRVERLSRCIKPGHGVTHMFQRRLVGGVIGGLAHCNGWNGIHGTESNMWLICLTSFYSFHSSHYNEPVLL